MQGREETSSSSEKLTQSLTPEDILDFYFIPDASENEATTPVGQAFFTENAMESDESQKISIEDYLDGFQPLEEDIEEGRTVSIFMCGTCANRDDKTNFARYFQGENVSHAFELTQGIENVDKIIVDGPGSGEKDLETLWVPYNNGKAYSDAAGQLGAYGLAERVAHIMAVLKLQPTTQVGEEAKSKLLDEHGETLAKPITRINLFGWSRGAAETIILAHLIASDPALAHISINMVLIDPVPGFALCKPKHLKLANSVKHCFIIYAEDERSFGFSPVVPTSEKDQLQREIRDEEKGKEKLKTSETTTPPENRKAIPKNSVVIPIVVPGGHAQPAGDNRDHGGKEVADYDLTDVAKLTRYITQQLLLYFGTPLDQTKTEKLTLKDLLPMYDNIKKNREGYKKAAQNEAYTALQLQGEERKALHQDYYWTNTSLLGIVNAMGYGVDKNKYIDYTERKLRKVIRIADTYVSALQIAIQQALLDGTESALSRGAILNSPSMITPVIRDISQQLHSQPLLCRAISEELQARFKPQDLQDLSKRANNDLQLDQYRDELIEEIVAAQLEKLTHEREQARELHEQHQSAIAQLEHELETIQEEKIRTIHDLEAANQEIFVRLQETRERQFELEQENEGLREQLEELKAAVVATQNEMTNLEEGKGKERLKDDEPRPAPEFKEEEGKSSSNENLSHSNSDSQDSLGTPEFECEEEIEEVHPNSIIQSIEAINAYLAQRALDTKVGITSLFGYSAKDYYLRRKDWLEILRLMVNDPQDSVSLLAKLESSIANFGHGRSTKFSNLLTELKENIETAIESSLLQDCLPLRKIKHDVKVYELQEQFTVQATNKSRLSLFANKIGTKKPLSLAEQHSIARYNSLLSKHSKAKEFLNVNELRHQETRINKKTGLF